MRINKENTIGLVIDMQENLVNGLYNKDTAINGCLQVINGLKILGVPIMVTQQYTEENGGTIPEINQSIGNFSYIEKKQFSCYREPSFIRVLNRVGKRNVVMIGAEAHISVLQTTLDLMYNNFNPVIIIDAIGASTEDNKKTAFWRMRDIGAVMSTTESILFELCREAGTSEYEEIIKLVNRK